jgi:CRISPR-associated protein Cmr1
MIQYAYHVRFNTPAFLGNVDQAGQWRTPPFKALLRQWWRVVNAPNHQYDHTALRESEGDLFGNAWLTDARKRSLFRRSRVSLRLDPWDSGRLGNQAWPGGPMESVTTTADGKGSVRADVYLGFGPVLPPSKKEGRSSVAIRQALAPGDGADFRVMAEESQQLTDALQLMAWFGTLGSRSRNGWGSLTLTAQDRSPKLTLLPTPDHRLLAAISRKWGDCLKLDWSHALGTVEGVPLLWFTKPYDNWRLAMGALANIKVGVRRVAKTFVSPDRIGGIHLLGYPAGGHWELSEFKRGRPFRDHEEARLATQLRFKVCAVREGLVGIVFHLPHGFPKDLLRRLNSAQQSWVTEHQAKVWAGIHGALDQMPRLTRFGGTK